MAPQKGYFDQFQPEEDYFGQFEHEPQLLSSHDEKPKPSLIGEGLDLLQSGADKASKFIGEHPTLRRFISGPSEEDLGGVKLNAPTTSPGEIPHIRDVAEYARQKLTNTGNYGAGYLGGLIKEWAPGLAEGAFDPGNAGIRTPSTLPRNVIQERLASLGKETPTSISTKVRPKSADIDPEILAEIHHEGGVLGGGGEYKGTKTRYEINSTENGLEVVDTSNNKTLLKTNDPKEAEALIEKLQPKELPNLPIISAKKRTASDYIKAVREGEIDPEVTKFNDWQSNESAIGPGHTIYDHYLETLPIEDRYQIISHFIDEHGPNWMSEFKKWYDTQKPPMPKEKPPILTLDEEYARRTKAAREGDQWEVMRPQYERLKASQEKMRFKSSRSARGDLDSIIEELINQRRMIDPQRFPDPEVIYNNMPSINTTTGPFYIHDAGARLTPEEMEALKSHPIVSQLGNDIAEIMQDVSSNFPTLAPRTERLGLSLDNRIKGINMVNPATRKSGIFINPMVMLDQYAPDQAAAGIYHTIVHELAHNAAGAHDERFTITLADLIQRLGEKDIAARQRIKQTLTGGGQEYLPEVQDLLSKYKESRGRPATIYDPLSTEGFGARNKELQRKSEIPNNPKSGPDGTDASVTKLLDAIAEAKPLREEQEAIYSAERGKRFREFGQVTETGKLGAAKQLGKLKGGMERVQGVKLNDVDVDQLFNLVRNNSRITAGEKAKGYTGLFKLLEGGNIPQRSELAVLDKTFGGGFADQIIQMHGGLGMVNLHLSKLANTMKTLNATLDLSAPFRQGLGLATRKEFWNSFAQMFKLAGSEKAFQALGEAIETHPNYLLSRDSGLFLADHQLGQYEEAFMNSYIGDIQESGKLGRLLTSPVRASERAYVGFLNKLRFDTFNSMLEKLVKQGYKAEDVSGPLAKYINVSTGRGELGRASKYADALNTVLFSPRLISSRLTILNPKYYVNAPDYLRKDAIRSLLGIAGVVGMADTVGSILGGQLKGSSLSSDFGKIKFGNSRLDPGGGFLQYIVLASRLVQNKTESSSGQTYDFAKNAYNAPNRWSLLFGDKNAPGFIENKFSPMASFISGMLRGKDFAGQPFNVSKELADRFTPLIIQDIRDVYNTDPSLLPMGLPAVMGMGLQTYSPRQRKGSLRDLGMSMSVRP